jgi:TatA/E family protein of Tat protein translocase
MFGISFEHILIVGVILLIMGPKRLPELGNTMGKAIKNFKDSISGIEEANFKRVTENKTAAANTAPVAPASTDAAPVTTAAKVSPASENSANI